MWCKASLEAATTDLCLSLLEYYSAVMPVLSSSSPYSSGFKRSKGRYTAIMCLQRTHSCRLHRQIVYLCCQGLPAMDSTDPTVHIPQSCAFRERQCTAYSCQLHHQVVHLCCQGLPVVLSISLWEKQKREWNNHPERADFEFISNKMHFNQDRTRHHLTDTLVYQR